MYDVAIVGAGPAGSICSIVCAKNGLKTILIEEHNEIGESIICGEGVSQQWLKKFFKTVDHNWVSTVINSAVFYSPSKRKLKIKFKNVGYILDRSVFDKEIADISREYGAEILTGTRAIGIDKNSVITNKGKIEAKIIVGADGRYSRIGRWSGFDVSLAKKDFWLTTQYLLETNEIKRDEVEFFASRDEVPGGYCWIFPKSSNTANVGCGISPLLTNKSSKFFLNNFIKWRFKNYKIIKEATTFIPTKRMKNLVKGNVCLVGDAGRLVDPISGGGIGNALLSGKLAGYSCVSAIKSGDIKKLKQYEENWQKEEGHKFNFKLKVKDICLKLKNEDIETIFDFGLKNFENKELNEIPNEIEIIKNIILFSPKLMKIGIKLLK